jgi:RHS repeat-associated protein
MVQEVRDTSTSSYVYSPDGPYTPLARVDAVIGGAIAGAAIDRARTSSRIYHFHTDPVGTPLELTDEAGELAWAGKYSAWGKVERGEDALLLERTEQPLRFPGQYADSATGLHYNTFRYYDPDVGRYIGQDPIGLSGGINLYAYCPNPMAWYDPLGWAGNPANATHITYVGIKDGLPYVGYASKPGLGHDARDVLNYRYSSSFDQFDVAPKPIFSGDGQTGKDIARGLEQRVFEQNDGLNGTSNKQNPVGEHNPNRARYLNAADDHLAKSNAVSKGPKGASGC